MYLPSEEDNELQVELEAYYLKQMRTACVIVFVREDRDFYITSAGAVTLKIVSSASKCGRWSLPAFKTYIELELQGAEDIEDDIYRELSIYSK